MLRDAQTFPVSQSKLEVALFGATLSFEPTVPDMGMLLHWPSGQAQGLNPWVMGSYSTQWTSMYVLVNPNPYGKG